MSVASRRQRERQQRRDSILDAAQTAFIQRGFDVVTMDDVASEAEVGKGTLYLYFKNKEDLLLGVALRSQQALLRRVGEAAADAHDGLDLVRRLLLAIQRTWTSEPPDFVRFFLSCLLTDHFGSTDSPSAEDHGKHVRRVFNTILGAIERGKQDGTVRTDLESLALTVQLWGATQGMLMLHLQRDRSQQKLQREIDFDRLLEANIELIVDSLRPCHAHGDES